MGVVVTGRQALKYCTNSFAMDRVVLVVFLVVCQVGLASTKFSDSCDLDEDPTDKTKFRQSSNGIVTFHSCAPGTEFSLAQCTCVMATDKYIDHCATAECGFGHVCINMLGHFQCKKIECSLGFKLNAKEECVDVDECVEFPGCCGQLSCQNTIGSYVCYCEDGLEVDSDGSCKDINECEGHSPCSANEYCENYYGSFECHALKECSKGYKRIANGKCADIDECVEFPGCCGEQSCRNTEGSYECYCEPGYKLNKLGQCMLVKDEVKCEFEEDLTDETKYKQKVFGRLFTRSCARGTVFSIAQCGCVIPEITHQKCLDGFKHNAKGECVDVDECVEFPGCCGDQSCRNTEG